MYMLQNKIVGQNIQARVNF